MRTYILFVVFIVAMSGPDSARAFDDRTSSPETYGRVILGRHSPKAGMAKVVFDHWLHRAQYTCRLCHVDIGFLMEAGATGITAADNMKGYYCGTCHNGTSTYDGRKIFAACSKAPSAEEVKRCKRCHYSDRNSKLEQDFYSFAEHLPKERFGNGIDWGTAEEKGLLKPIDYLEGISVKRAPLAIQKDFSIVPETENMPDIIFSHKKHTASNGCELCHPDIFIGVKKGATKYSMIELFEGKYCGACHDKVAFPQTDCQRCHTKQVQ